MQSKEYKVGDKLYKVVESHALWSNDPPEWSQEEVTIVKANNSSIYTKKYEDGKGKYTMRYPIRAKFPLSPVESPGLGEYWYLTDDPDMAKKETNDYNHKVEVNIQLQSLYSKISDLPIKSKEEMIDIICDKLEAHANE